MTNPATIEEEAEDVAAEIGEIVAQKGITVAVAESLTGGKLVNQLAAAKGSGQWLAGGAVAYQSSAKHRVLGVSEGPVISEEAVVAMVEGVTALFGADVGVAASGAGGPDGQEGKSPGTTWLAAEAQGNVETELHHFSGEPLDILAQTQLCALQLLRSALLRHTP
jgi:nicotinamide-nucleotide amidase